MRIWQPLTLSLYGLRQWGIPTRQWGIWYQHKHFDLFTERFHARGEDRPERLDVGAVTAHESWMLYICSLHATTVQSAQLISFLCRHPPSWPWTQRPGHRGWTWTRTPTPLRASTRQHQRTFDCYTKQRTRGYQIGQRGLLLSLVMISMISSLPCRLAALTLWRASSWRRAHISCWTLFFSCASMWLFYVSLRIH